MGGLKGPFRCCDTLNCFIEICKKCPKALGNHTSLSSLMPVSYSIRVMVFMSTVLYKMFKI